MPDPTIKYGLVLKFLYSKFNSCSYCNELFFIFENCRNQTILAIST